MDLIEKQIAEDEDFVDFFKEAKSTKVLNPRIEIDLETVTLPKKLSKKKNVIKEMNLEVMIENRVIVNVNIEQVTLLEVAPAAENMIIKKSLKTGPKVTINI